MANVEVAGKLEDATTVRYRPKKPGKWFRWDHVLADNEQMRAWALRVQPHLGTEQGKLSSTWDVFDGLKRRSPMKFVRMIGSACM
jgi:hypothetical protein